MITNQLAKDIHQANREKGFWDIMRTNKEVFALINSEVYEALEAHRKGRVCGEMLQEPICNYDFATHIKDTFEDEMADVAIRMLDWIGCVITNGCLTKHCIEINLADITQEKSNQKLYGNTPTQLFDLNEMVNDVFKTINTSNISHAIYRFFSYIYSIANHNGFDLDKHIKLKLEYNKTRPYKHNKRY